MNITRRHFINSALAATAVPATLSLSGCDDLPSGEVFAHGVASGDPLADRVILWTRVSIPNNVKLNPDNLRVDVKWEVSTTQNFAKIVAQGKINTDKSRDFTVKVDATGLSPNTTYFYRFIVVGVDVTSPIGQTKTLPEGSVEQVKLAMTSCSHHAFGYFNVYAQIAMLDDIDAVLHLGDYIYEYGKNDIYNNAFLFARQHEPAHEIVTLEDYRTRHAQYKRDEDSQAMLARHPLIAIWDDHEFANDAWKDGAQNHDSSEGEWKARAQAAIQAYYEWMPIREPVAGAREKAFRRFNFGDLLDLNMLDTRFYGRDQQIEKFDGSESDPDRSLLGREQEEWLETQLLNAQNEGVRWKLLGQQVQMMQIRLFGKYINKDAWDGYQASRQRLLSYIADKNIDNVVVLTGDVHSSWAAEIAPNPYDSSKYDPWSGEGAVAVELVTPSTTSPTIPVPGLQLLVGDIGKAVRIENQHIKYVDLKNRGFVKITANAQQLRADWYHVPFVQYRNRFAVQAKSFVVRNGVAKLDPA